MTQAIETSAAPNGAPQGEGRAFELAALTAAAEEPREEETGAVGHDAAPAEAKPAEKPVEPEDEDKRPVSAGERAEFRKFRTSEERRLQAVESTLKEREAKVAEAEKTASSYLDDPFESFQALAKRRGVGVEVIVSELNAKLKSHGTPEATRSREQQAYEERIAKLEARLKEREEQETTAEQETAFEHEMRGFLGEVESAKDKYPALWQHSDEWIRSEAKALVRGPGAQERLRALAKALGRPVTNDDIAKALDIRARSFQRGGTPNRAPGPSESANREETANGNGGSARRAPPATSGTLAADRPTSPKDMSPEERRKWELAALTGG